MKIQLPNDADYLEREIYTLIVKGSAENCTTAYLYSNIKDPINKFIFAYVFDMGNTRKELEIALGLSKVAIWSRIKTIKKEIGTYAKEKKLVV